MGGCPWIVADNYQAQKFQNLDDNDSDDELGEESLLETPLDKIEPYQLFRNALASKFKPPVQHVINILTSPRTSTRTTPALRISHYEPQPTRTSDCPRCHPPSRSKRRQRGTIGRSRSSWPSTWSACERRRTLSQENDIYEIGADYNGRSGVRAWAGVLDVEIWEFSFTALGCGYLCFGGGGRGSKRSILI